jgi:hypothetical protein
LPPMVKDAKSYPPLLSAGDWLIALLPDDVEKQFTDFLEKRNQAPDVGPDDTTANDQPAGDTPPADISSSAPGA